MGTSRHIFTSSLTSASCLLKLSNPLSKWLFIVLQVFSTPTAQRSLHGQFGHDHKILTRVRDGVWLWRVQTTNLVLVHSFRIRKFPSNLSLSLESMHGRCTGIPYSLTCRRILPFEALIGIKIFISADILFSTMYILSFYHALQYL